MNPIIEHIERRNQNKKTPTSFQVGDIVDVHVRIREGDKERTQIFTGTVIKIKGGGKNIRSTFTVRRIVAGEGVERVFPIHSRRVETVKVRRPGKVRRAKLYYLRERVGKATKVRERRVVDKEPDKTKTSATDEPVKTGKTAKKKKRAKKKKADPVGVK